MQMIGLPTSVFVGLFLSACLINIQPLFLLLYPPNINSMDSSVFLLYLWKHCCQFDSQTELMTHFDVETHWQCSLGIKRAGRGQRRAVRGLLSLLLSGLSVLERGFRVGVIHWDVRDRIPLGWKCNMTGHNGKGRGEHWLNFHTTEQAIALGFSYGLELGIIWFNNPA